MSAYDNTEEVIGLMERLSIGSEVLYSSKFGSYGFTIKKGFITAIQKHISEEDPFCGRCIGKIGIDGEPPICMMSNIICDGNKYDFRIKSIIHGDFLKEEDMEI